MARHELNQCLRADSIDAAPRQEEIRDRWRAASAAFRSRTEDRIPSPDAIVVREIAPAQHGYLRSLESDEQFRRTFSSVRTSFADVEIDPIVAAQRSVNLDFIDLLKRKVPKDADGLLRFCLGPGEATAGVRGVRNGAAGFSFTSDHPGLSFLGAWEGHFGSHGAAEPGGQPMVAITAVLGFPASTINGFRVGPRVILNNGFHRLYTLRALGFESAPIVLLEIDNVELEMPESIADLPSAYLAEAPRPSMMADFFDEALVCVLTQPTPLRVLQIAWNINSCIVPKG